MIILRDYQNEAVASVYDYWKTGRGSNPLIVAPTGSGKSLIVADLCRSAIKMSPSVRILILTHKQELISQNYLELKNLYPECEAGVFSAGLNRKDKHQNVIFAGIQSIAKKIHTFEPFNIVIVDEAHTIPKKSDTQYGQAKETLLLMNPKVKFVGLTATPYRLDSGRLFGPGCLFCGISYEISVSFLIKEGYLSNVICKGGSEKIDLSSVKKRGGEYLPTDLAHAASDSDLVKSVVKEVIECGVNRKAWLVFASGIDHADLLKIEFLHQGVESVKVLTGKTPKVERVSITDEFKSGQLKCLINIGVLTTGFNAPICDLIAMVRATMSTALYVQIVGRGMRVYPGKENCLFLDYGNNVIEHGPIDAIPMARAKSESSEPGECPQKECPKCHSFVHIVCKECLDCGFLFPERESEFNHQPKAFRGAILTDQIKPELIEIDNVTYAKKLGSKDTLKATYWAGIRMYNEWLCLDHFGYSAEKAQAHIRKLGGKATTVTEALAECENYITPHSIKVIFGGKYPDIKKVLF